VKAPRISIAGLMGVVLLVALDFGLGKTLVDPPILSMPLRELLPIGLFPMANILAAGLAILVAARREPGPGHPALVGFEAFGLAAWLAFLACSLIAPHAIYDSIRPVTRASGLTPGLALATFAPSLFLLPQLDIAWIGSHLGRLFIVRWSFSIERRVRANEPARSGLDARGPMIAEPSQG